MCSYQFAVCHALCEKIICYTIYCLPIDISKDTYKIVFTIANEKKVCFCGQSEKKEKKKEKSKQINYLKLETA